MNPNIIAIKSQGKKLTHTSFLTFISIIFSNYFRESNALKNSGFLITSFSFKRISDAIMQKSF